VIGKNLLPISTEQDILKL